MKLLIIGISGVTCGGKTMLASQLKEYFPKSILISQDDYFLDVDDPRHTWIPELNHINYDILSSLDMDKMYSDIQDVVKNKETVRISEVTKKPALIQTVENLKIKIHEALKNCPIQILIVEGFCIFNYKPLQNLFHLKYYFTLTREECLRRRNLRVYEPPDCPGYFEKCVWPEHEKQLAEVQRDMTDVHYLDGTSRNLLFEVLSDIQILLENS